MSEFKIRIGNISIEKDDIEDVVCVFVWEKTSENIDYKKMVGTVKYSSDRDDIEISMKDENLFDTLDVDAIKKLWIMLDCYCNVVKEVR